MTQSLPFSLTIKPIGAKCNLDCSYCYYLNKDQKCGTSMSLATLETAIKNHIQSQPKHTPNIDFIWHGGEPLLRGIEFYYHAFQLQQHWAGSRKIINTFQTNGTLINRRWAEFFKRNHVMVGVSVDGPKTLNDLSRVDLKGQSSFANTERGITHLQESGVEFNTLTVVNNQTYQHGVEIYDYLKQLGSTYFQFQPCLDHELDRRSEYDWSLTGAQWGRFLCEVFDLWCQEDIGKIHVQFFENCLMILMGYPSQMCHHSETCGQQLMVEKEGTVFSCDHYHYPQHQLGNIEQVSLQSIVTAGQQRDFGEDKQRSLSDKCKHCDFLPMCNGGCPKYRTQGEQSANMLCDGYQMFFRYALPRMLKMVDAMNQGYSAQYYQLF